MLKRAKEPLKESQPNMINESCAYDLELYALTYMNRLMRLSWIWIRSILFKNSKAHISIPFKYLL